MRDLAHLQRPIGGLLFTKPRGSSKTLVTLELLKDSVESGDLDGQQVFSRNGTILLRESSVEKVRRIVEQLGVEMLVDLTESRP